MRRALGLAGFCLLALAVACSDDGSDGIDTNADSSDMMTDTGAPLADLPDTDDSGAEGAEGAEGGAEGGADGGEGGADDDMGTQTCGDGMVDEGEHCDGDDLDGSACADLGYAGGTLACDPMTCTFDTSACMGGGSEGGGTTG